MRLNASRRIRHGVFMRVNSTVMLVSKPMLNAVVCTPTHQQRYLTVFMGPSRTDSSPALVSHARSPMMRAGTVHYVRPSRRRRHLFIPATGHLLLPSPAARPIHRT